MNTDFARFVEKLEPTFRALMAMQPVKYAGLPSQMPERGIYLFSENNDHLYVGRTNRIRKRLAGHCRPSSTHFSATFAFRVARKETGLLKATYTTQGSRAELVKHAVFGPAFQAAKVRLATMQLRFLEENHPASTG